MIAHHSTFGFKKIFLIVFGIAFSLVAVAVIAKSTLSSSNDNRSKASEENKIYKQWEFNKNSEGWAGIPNKVHVDNGILKLTSSNAHASLQTSLAHDIFIPKGEKIFRMFMYSKSTTELDGNLEYNYTDSKGDHHASRPFSASNITVTGTGGWAEYSITLPQGNDITMTGGISINFTNLTNGSTVQIDWIRILGPLSSDTPTPTP